MKITPSKSGFGTIFFYLMFYPLRPESLIIVQSLQMALWATAISIRAGHHHPAKKGAIQRVKPSLTFLEWPWGHRREGARTVCVYVCVNGCFAPLIMPQRQLGPEGIGGGWGGGGLWLADVFIAILSDTESPFTVIVYWCPEGGDAWKHLHVKQTMHEFMAAKRDTVWFRVYLHLSFICIWHRRVKRCWRPN